ASSFVAYCGQAAGQAAGPAGRPRRYDTSLEPQGVLLLGQPTNSGTCHGANSAKRHHNGRGAAAMATHRQRLQAPAGIEGSDRGKGSKEVTGGEPPEKRNSGLGQMPQAARGSSGRTRT